MVELTVVIPTLNERDNIGPLVSRLKHALAGVRWQIIVVDDDSRDGTAECVKALAHQDLRIQCLRRVGRRGLAGAVLEGALASAAPIVAVMDADLQHDETLLPRMLGEFAAGDVDLVVASRYLEAGGASDGLGRWRALASRTANRLARHVLKAEVTDPVSGFFMIRRAAIDALAPRLSQTGFKILFDIIASARGGLRIKETPYAFAPRLEGRSKFDGKVTLDYLGLVFSKLSRDLVSPRALMFALVGSSGLVVHLTVLELTLAAGFTRAQLLAALTAMSSNYLINNALTYRDRRRAGWRMLGGYIRFCALCGVGLLANVAVADLVRDHGGAWWLAGASGAAVGAGWNYLTTALVVW
jgi:dolichol-phosphate mannosyltransferase